MEGINRTLFGMFLELSWKYRNRGNTRNNEKVVYFPFSYQKRAYFDVTSGNFANFDSEKVQKREIFGQQDILQFFSRESKD